MNANERKKKKNTGIVKRTNKRTNALTHDDELINERNIHTEKSYTRNQNM